MSDQRPSENHAVVAPVVVIACTQTEIQVPPGVMARHEGMTCVIANSGVYHPVVHVPWS